MGCGEHHPTPVSFQRRLVPKPKFFFFAVYCPGKKEGEEVLGSLKAYLGDHFPHDRLNLVHITAETGASVFKTWLDRAPQSDIVNGVVFNSSVMCGFTSSTTVIVCSSEGLGKRLNR